MQNKPHFVVVDNRAFPNWGVGGGGPTFGNFPQIIPFFSLIVSLMFLLLLVPGSWVLHDIPKCGTKSQQELLSCANVQVTGAIQAAFCISRSQLPLGKC